MKGEELVRAGIDLLQKIQKFDRCGKTKNCISYLYSYVPLRHIGFYRLLRLFLPKLIGCFKN